jgi:hypothetical protein
MSKLVEKWNKHAANPRLTGLDSVNLDGVEHKLVMPEQRLGSYDVNSPSKGIEKMKNPNHKVSVNRGATQELVMLGPEIDVMNFKREIERTLNRLGIKRLGRVRPFAKIEFYKGGRPSIHGLIRWLDDLTFDIKYESDISFLKRIYVTILNRNFTVPEDEE